MNVEDKIIGPFTLRQFAFVFVAAIVTVIVMLILTKLGMSMMPSLLVGAFFGSFSLLACFIKFNGRPFYAFAGAFLYFFMKPRQRAWKKTNDQIKKQSPEQKNTTAPEKEPLPPKKASLEGAEGEIERISLMIDTGGAYNTQGTSKSKTDPNTIFDKSSPTTNKNLEEARKEVEKKNSGTEDVISNMATIDPKKKFEYTSPNTSKYKVDDVTPKITNSQKKGK